MKFLLLKDIKEIANAQIAHLVLPETQDYASQNQKSYFFTNAPPTKILTLSTDKKEII